LPVVRRLSVAAADLRVGVPLVGAFDGANQTYDAPDRFVQEPPGASIAVYYNGVRQEAGGDYTVSTTGPAGTGEQVTMTFAPFTGDKLTADYVAA